MNWRTTIAPSTPSTPSHGGGFVDGFSFGGVSSPSNYGRTSTSTTTTTGRYGSQQQQQTPQQTPAVISSSSFGAFGGGDRSTSAGGRDMTSSGEFGHEPSQRFLPSVFAPSPTHSQLEPSTPNLRASQQRNGRRDDQFSDLFYDDPINTASNLLSTPSTPTPSLRKNLDTSRLPASSLDYSPAFNSDQLRSSSSGLKMSSALGVGGGALPPPGASLYDLEEFEPPTTDMNVLPSTRSGDQFKPLSPFSTSSHISSSITSGMAITPIRNGASEKDERWVTVFGFPAGQTSVILRHFQNYGSIINHQPSPMNGNWVHIQYQTVQQARNALGKNGKLVDSFMIGVCDCNDEVAFHGGVGGLGGALLGGMKKQQVLHTDYNVEPSDLLRRIPQPRNSIWSLFLEYVLGI